MTKCNPGSKSPIRFSSVRSRKVEAEFDGGAITGNGGISLLAEVDRRMGLTHSVSERLEDTRRQASCEHSVKELLRQRVYALALGYEDLNDHRELRHDPALQTATSRTEVMASPSTLCRLERRADREDAVAIHQVLFEQFVKAHDTPPERLVLDFDATDTLLHGEQEERFYNGYYRGYCYLPLYVFCGRHLLVSYLRSSGKDQAHHALAILSLLVKALRARWPEVEIVFRGDAGFCRPRLLRWCERRNVRYVVGMARNVRLRERAKELIEGAAQDYRDTGEKQRQFGWVSYGARSWGRERRVIVKAEHTALGSNPRFVVTDLPATDPDPATAAADLYDRMYCARGDMENRIKDQQLDLFADRASCQRFDGNQFRLLLSSLTYTLIEGLRRMALTRTELAKASPNRIRLTLLRIGAVVLRNTRRIRILLSSACPHQSLFRTVVAQVAYLDTS